MPTSHTIDDVSTDLTVVLAVDRNVDASRCEHQSKL
jgi:hypothetical protein